AAGVAAACLRIWPRLRRDEPTGAARVRSRRAMPGANGARPRVLLRGLALSGAAHRPVPQHLSAGGREQRLERAELRAAAEHQRIALVLQQLAADALIQYPSASPEPRRGSFAP